MKNDRVKRQIGAALHKLLNAAAALEKELGVRVNVSRPDPIHMLALEGGLQATTYAIVIYVSVESSEGRGIEA
jgi:hypothetical protein